MNCETIDSILDDHRVARLGVPERRDVDAHLRTCDRCAEAWTMQHLLVGERFDAPPAGLFERLTSRLPDVAATLTPATATRRRWLSPALAAGVLLAVAVALWRLPDRELDVESASAPAPAPSVVGPVEPLRPGPELIARTDYELVGPGSLPAMSGGRVQVVEFFAYWCNPCYAFESELVRWKQTVEPRIEVVRIPVVWNPRSELQARAHYTAAALGRLDIVHGPMFEEIHRGGNALDSAGALAKLFAQFGVDVAAFDEAFNSSAVDAQVERAAALAREYGITSTPSLVIGGRYRTSPGLAGSAERALAVAERLAATSAVCDRTTCSSQRASDPTRTLDLLRERTREPIR
jgi:thiol:disulfide interchange protein DsbA